MIQRIQTLWLLAATASAALTFKFSFYSGNQIGKDNLPEFKSLTATSNIFLITLTAILVAGSLFVIFLYNKRKKQLRFTIIIILISIINLVLYFNELKKFTSGTISLTSVFAFAIPVLLFFAIRGIWKDEKLVKSLDRLR